MLENTLIIPSENTCIYWPFQTVLTLAKHYCECETHVASSSPFYLRRLPSSLIAFKNLFVIQIFLFLSFIYLYSLRIIRTRGEFSKRPAALSNVWPSCVN